MAGGEGDFWTVKPIRWVSNPHVGAPTLASRGNDTSGGAIDLSRGALTVPGGNCGSIARGAPLLLAERGYICTFVYNFEKLNTPIRAINGKIYFLILAQDQNLHGLMPVPRLPSVFL